MKAPYADLTGGVEGLVEIPGVDAGLESVIGSIDHGYGLVKFLIRVYGDNGSKNFFGDEVRMCRNTGEDGGGDGGAVPVAAGDQRRASAARLSDPGFDAFGLVFGDQGADFGGVFERV